MAVELATGYVSLVPSAKGFGAAVEKEIGKPVTDAADGTAKAASSKLGGIGTAISGAFAVGAVTAFGKSAIDAFQESAKVGAQTEAVIKSTGGAAGVSADHIGDLANQLKGISGVEDESIQSGENLLLTFTNIKGTNFDAATKTMLDMATAMGTDASSQAIQLGKALNDPVKGISALSRVGVTFTDQQKSQIEAMTKAGDVAGAQKVILGELNKEFGGSAKALGETLTPMDKLGLKMGDLQESAGGVIVSLADKLEPALGFVADHMNIIAPAVLAVAAAFVTYKAVTLAISAAQKIQTGVQWALNAAMNANPVMLVVAAIAALVAGVVLAYQHFEPFRNIVDAVGRAIRDGLGAALEWITGTLWPAISGIVTSLGSALGNIVGFFTGLPSAILGALGDVGSWLVDVGQKILGGLLDGLVLYLETLKLFYIDLPLKILGFLGDVTVWLVDKGKDVLAGFLNGIVAKVVDVSTFFTGLAGKVLGWLGDVGQWLFEAGKKVLEGMWNGFMFYLDILKTFYIDLPLKILGYIGRAELWLVDKGKDVIGGLVGGITDKAGDLWAFFTGLPGEILHIVAGLAGKFGEIGKSIFDGIIGGIGDLGAAGLDLAAGAARMIGNLGKGIINGVVQAINDMLPNSVGKVEVAGHTIFPGLDLPDNPIPKLRALGGPVSKWQSYIVGERGPELFVPGQNGFVIPNDMLQIGNVAFTDRSSMGLDKHLWPVGQQIIDGLRAGMEDRADALKGWVTGFGTELDEKFATIAAKVAEHVATMPAGAIDAVGAGASAAATGRVGHITTADMFTPEQVAALQQQARDTGFLPSGARVHLSGRDQAALNDAIRAASHPAEPPTSVAIDQVNVTLPDGDDATLRQAAAAVAAHIRSAIRSA